MGNRAYLVTKNPYEGAQRKIAWFNRQENGLYFDFPYIQDGGHFSFHKDGSTWRTGVSTGMKAEKTGYSVPIDDISVWTQLGISVFHKSVIKSFPDLKDSDKKHVLYELDLTQFPSEYPNFVVECIHPEILEVIPDEMNPPNNANVIIINDWEPYVVITILGHDENQLVQITNGNFSVHHFNERYSAKRKGITYRWVAIGEE